jgi:hypothetical protein
MVVLEFLKIHYQNQSNVYGESYIDLDIIFNYIRELFLPDFISYKVFVWNCIIMY